MPALSPSADLSWLEQLQAARRELGHLRVLVGVDDFAVLHRVSIIAADIVDQSDDSFGLVGSPQSGAVRQEQQQGRRRGDPLCSCCRGKIVGTMELTIFVYANEKSLSNHPRLHNWCSFSLLACPLGCRNRTMLLHVARVELSELSTKAQSRECQLARLSPALGRLVEARAGDLA